MIDEQTDEVVEGEIVSADEAEALVQAEQSAELVVAEREKPQPPVNIGALPAKAEWLATREVAVTIAATPFVPKGYRGQPEAVMAAILYGREIGLGPMQALQQIHIIEGKPSLSADLMLAQMRKGGLVISESESTTTRAVIKAKRVDTGEEAEVEWNIEEAQAAGLAGKDNWRKYPADMLWARCVGRLARRLGSDLLGGLVYSHEEVADWDDTGKQVDATASRTSAVVTTDGVELRSDAPRDGWKGIYEALEGMLGRDLALGWLRVTLSALTGKESREEVEEVPLRDAGIRIANGVTHLQVAWGGGFPPPDRKMVAEAFAHPDSVGQVLDGPDLPHDPQEGDAAATRQAESDAEAASKGSDRAEAENAADERGAQETLLDEQAAEAARNEP